MRKDMRTVVKVHVTDTLLVVNHVSITFNETDDRV